MCLHVIHSNGTSTHSVCVCKCVYVWEWVWEFAYVVPCVFLRICVAVYCSGVMVISTNEEPSRVVVFVTPECSGSLCVNGDSDAHTSACYT